MKFQIGQVVGVVQDEYCPGDRIGIVVGITINTSKIEDNEIQYQVLLGSDSNGGSTEEVWVSGRELTHIDCYLKQYVGDMIQVNLGD